MVPDTHIWMSVLSVFLDEKCTGSYVSKEVIRNKMFIKYFMPGSAKHLTCS